MTMIDEVLLNPETLTVKKKTPKKEKPGVRHL